jgi:ubiquitin-like domain-containing CTD phosphatase 1
MKWRGTNYEISIAESDTVVSTRSLFNPESSLNKPISQLNQGDLKAILFSLTGVPPDRMKLVGLIKGKLPGDNEEVVKLGLGGPTTTTKKKEFMMIGTPEGQEHKSVGPVNTGDEPDIDYATAGAATREALKAMESIRNRRKLKETAEGLQLDKMREPRMGKKLLGKLVKSTSSNTARRLLMACDDRALAVLDLDGCILDTSLWKEPNFSTQFVLSLPFLYPPRELICISIAECSCDLIFTTSCESFRPTTIL